MLFNDFIKTGKARKATPDIQLIKSLLSTSEKNLGTLKVLPINEVTKESALVMCYEALREIVEAIAMKEGYKVYSHEAFTFFLKEKINTEISEKFDKYRKLRNGVNYYGKEIPIEEVTYSIKDIKQLINELKDKYLITFPK